VFAALGFLGLVARLKQVAAWLHFNRRSQVALLASALTLVSLLHVADLIVGNAKEYKTRGMAADVGCWLGREVPGAPKLVGPVGITPIVSYYAHGTPFAAFRWEADNDAIVSMVNQNRADVVLLRPTKQLTVERCRVLIDRLQQFGLQPVTDSTLPVLQADMQVLVRSQRNDNLARRPR
jgi:hypothetical protein